MDDNGIILTEIEHLKIELDNMRPLPQATLFSLREKLYLDWTYNSNAIEGNTLSLIETKVVLEGITVGGKTLTEHLEIINHRDAILYLEEIVCNKEMLTEWTIKNLHQLVLKGIDDDAGCYRKVRVEISGASHSPPEPFLIKEQMEALIGNYNSSWKEKSVTEKAALLHGEFVKIHPFVDGNGRTARLLLNLELMKTGYPPIVIKKVNRLEYYRSLDKAHTTGDYSDFVYLVACEVKSQLMFYLDYDKSNRR